MKFVDQMNVTDFELITTTTNLRTMNATVLRSTESIMELAQIKDHPNVESLLIYLMNALSANDVVVDKLTRMVLALSEQAKVVADILEESNATPI